MSSSACSVTCPRIFGPPPLDEPRPQRPPRNTYANEATREADAEVCDELHARADDRGGLAADLHGTMRYREARDAGC